MMSMPTFPTPDPSMEFKDSLNMILASIAMEELGLSHIINAEGEKLQYILGTLKEKPACKVSVEELLNINKSIKNILDSVMQNQVLLKSKMEYAIDAMKEQEICPKPLPPEPCRTISFTGYPDQCWNAGKALKWVNSDCSKCSSLYLSSDCKKIILKSGRCYVVNLTLDLCAPKHDGKCISIGIQTMDSGKQMDRFVFHQPILCPESPTTVSASGIFVSTCSSYRFAELMITLMSPDVIKVRQSSISIMEI